MANLILILVIGNIFAFDNVQNKPISLYIYNISQTDEFLTFDYEVKNNSKSPIWICQNIDAFHPLQYEIQLDAEKKIAKIRQANFVVPKNIFLEAAILAKYIKVKKDESYKSQAKLNLALQEINPLKPNKKDFNCTKKFVAEKVIFEIGIIKNGSMKAIKWLLSTFQDKDISRDDNVVYLSYSWVMRYLELIISHSIENISVLCCVVANN